MDHSLFNQAYIICHTSIDSEKELKEKLPALNQSQYREVFVLRNEINDFACKIADELRNKYDQTQLWKTVEGSKTINKEGIEKLSQKYPFLNQEAAFTAVNFGMFLSR